MKFIKDFPRLSSGSVEKLYRHSIALHLRLSMLKGVITPKPLDKIGGQIVYEFINLPPPLIPQMQQMACTEEQFVSLGKILAFVHAEITSCGSLLHGDFVIHNIFIKDDIIYLIDPHPPEVLEYKDDCIYGDPRRELPVFVFSIFGDIGLRKILRSLKGINYYTGLACSFLGGYQDKSENEKIISVSSCGRCMVKLYQLRKLSKFSTFSSLSHCLLCFMFSMMVLSRYKWRQFQEKK